MVQKPVDVMRNWNSKRAIPASTTLAMWQGGRNCSPTCAVGTDRGGRLPDRRWWKYNAEETRIWREVSPKLHELHVPTSMPGVMYNRAKSDLAITETENPQLRDISTRLERETNIHLVPAEGALPYRTFYEYIGGA